jgi:shikimate dehydrogenase
VELRNARCAVIGAGGAARSALWILHHENARVTLFARDVEKAKSLAEKFGANYASLNDASFQDLDLVINATPLGTVGVSEAETPARADRLRGTRFVYDLVYNPRETLLLREAREAGCETIGGIHMLVAQAAEQFRLWTGSPAPLDVMNRAAKQMLDAGC